MADKKTRLEETPNDAIKHYELAVRDNSGNGEAHFNLATAYYAAHDFDLAEKEFEESARLQDTLYHAHLYLGVLAARRGNLDKARQELQRVASEANTFILKAQAKTLLSDLTRGK
jgi:tetratricopeptide (TPR) repeat protein